ncbi:MAG: hypothetical protein HWE13_04370 [Gammaproteobacteria bacterium]|nr:hypothetical protein [Gammaproteobacteria bacterium]NVK87333.1 hypothetical protein [Gammaproteobacteria bacterium]
MDIELSQQDLDYIWQVVDHAAQNLGGYHQLFASPLELTDSDDRVVFNWPVWMRAIKAYIHSQYGEKASEQLLLPILTEVYNPQKYQDYQQRKTQSQPLVSNAPIQFLSNKS